MVVERGARAHRRTVIAEDHRMTAVLLSKHGAARPRLYDTHTTDETRVMTRAITTSDATTRTAVGGPGRVLDLGRRVPTMTLACSRPWTRLPGEVYGISVSCMATPADISEHCSPY